MAEELEPESFVTLRGTRIEGKLAWSPGLTITLAVKKMGGFPWRAPKYVFLIRDGERKKVDFLSIQYHKAENIELQPGDTVTEDSGEPPPPPHTTYGFTTPSLYIEDRLNHTMIAMELPKDSFLPTVISRNVPNGSRQLAADLTHAGVKTCFAPQDLWSVDAHPPCAQDNDVIDVYLPSTVMTWASKEAIRRIAEWSFSAPCTTPVPDLRIVKIGKD
jgi:hypothetical protein